MYYISVYCTRVEVSLKLNSDAFVFAHLTLFSSALVGLATILLMFPIPGYVAKRIQHVQVIRLKATDARVQHVTESML